MALSLPPSGEAGEDRYQPLAEINVTPMVETRVGEVYIGDERIEPGDLAERLAGLAAEDPTRIVYVRGDQTISYTQLMEALGLVNRAGFSKVTLVAEAAGSK